MKDYAIQSSPDAPALNTRNFPWTRPANLIMKKSAFPFFSRNGEAAKVAYLFISNSCHELEPVVLDLAAAPGNGNGIIPIGPLLASNRLGNSVGHYSLLGRRLFLFEVA